MADKEKEDPEESPPPEEEGDDEDERDEELAELKARVAELEALLAERPQAPPSQGTRWAGWALGTLVGATSLALIVVILGGGWPWPCDCSEPSSAASANDQEERLQHQQQAQLELLLREHSGDFQECFESWASSHSSELHPGWAVIVRLEIHADQSGRPQQVEATGENLPAPLGDCLEARVQLWTFPGPGPYTMELPFAIEGDPHQRPGEAGDAGDAGSAPAEAGPSTPAEAGQL